MGGYLGSVGNGFQNQENLTNEPDIGGTSYDPYQHSQPSHLSEFYTGSTPAGTFQEQQQGLMIVPSFIPVSDITTPADLNEWEETLWRNRLYTSSTGDGFAIDASDDPGAATMTLKYIDANPETWIYDVLTLTKVSVEIGTDAIIYTSSIAAANQSLQTYSGGSATLDYAVVSVNQGTKTVTFTATTEVTWAIQSKFEWINSTGNDGFYEVASSSWSSNILTIVTVEAIPDATADGDGQRVGGVLCKESDIKAAFCGISFPQSYYNSASSDYIAKEQAQIIQVTYYNGNFTYMRPWGDGRWFCQVEVISSSRQPKGTLQTRWAGPQAPNSMTFIYKHHITGEIYKGTVARTTFFANSTVDLEVQAFRNTGTDDLTFLANIGEFGTDGEFEFQFTGTQLT